MTHPTLQWSDDVGAVCVAVIEVEESTHFGTFINYALCYALLSIALPLLENRWHLFAMCLFRRMSRRMFLYHFGYLMVSCDHV